MVNHAVFFTPLRLTAGALIVVTSFRLHDAHIAAREFLHTYEAVALRIAFLGFLTTRATVDIASVS
jgi:hypothetical protein